MAKFNWQVGNKYITRDDCIVELTSTDGLNDEIPGFPLVFNVVGNGYTFTACLDGIVSTREGGSKHDIVAKFPATSAPLSTLPADAQARKDIPIFSGFINYFPDAIAAVAELSRIGNDQHNPGKPLHWDRSKSGDEKDALMRHLVEAGTIDTDNVRHSTKVAWRALANLQKELEEANAEKD